MLAGKLSPGKVPGLVYRTESGIETNPPGRVEDLDALPQLDRGYLDRYYREGIYWNLAGRGKLDMMISSRGCPYNCRFCFQVSERFRFRSVGHLMEEFEELRRRGVRSIHIQDDAFTVDRSRCLEIGENLIRGGYRFDLKIRSRVDAVDRKLLERLKRVGVKQIVYGFESGSDRVLEAMGKKTTVAQNLEAARLTKEAGIGCYGEIMVGYPGETPETVEATIASPRKAKPIVADRRLRPRPLPPPRNRSLRGSQKEWNPPGRLGPEGSLALDQAPLDRILLRPDHRLEKDSAENPARPRNRPLLPPPPPPGPQLAGD